MKRRAVHSQLDAFGESVIVPSAVGRRLLLLFILSAAEILKILQPAPNHAKLYTRTSLTFGWYLRKAHLKIFSPVLSDEL